MQLKWVQLATVSVHIIYYYKSTTKSCNYYLIQKKGQEIKLKYNLLYIKQNCVMYHPLVKSFIFKSSKFPCVD